MKIEDAVTAVQEALDSATRGMSANDYIEVLDELIDEFKVRYSVAIEETGD